MYIKEIPNTQSKLYLQQIFTNNLNRKTKNDFDGIIVKLSIVKYKSNDQILFILIKQFKI